MSDFRRCLHANIKNAARTVIVRKDALIGKVTTGSDGKGKFSADLPIGNKFYVKELSAPTGYKLNGSDVYHFTAAYTNDKEASITFSHIFTNEEIRGKLTIYKEGQVLTGAEVTDGGTTFKYEARKQKGATFAVYAGADIKSADGKVVVKKDTFIEKVPTGADGSAAFKSDLPINNSYYVKEIQAPKNYFRNQTDTFKFTFNYTNEKQAEVAFSHTFVNERVNARIDLTKVDKETGIPQGDAKFLKATYGLFARENISHPDGKTGVLYKAGAQVATLTTDADGKAFVEDLYLGKYFIKELIPSEGYLLDETEYDIDCAYDGDLVKTVKKPALPKNR